MELLLALTKINANILIIEYLRRTASYDEMGKYAKALVSESQVVDSLATQYAKIIDKRVPYFAAVVKSLYYAIAIWSLLHIYHAKLKTEKFDEGENFSKLAGACVGFVDKIGALHRDLLAIPKIKDTIYYDAIEFYFSKIMIGKCKEISSLYGLAFKNSSYNDVYFAKLTERDYISVSTK